MDPELVTIQSLLDGTTGLNQRLISALKPDVDRLEDIVYGRAAAASLQEHARARERGDALREQMKRDNFRVMGRGLMDWQELPYPTGEFYDIARRFGIDNAVGVAEYHQGPAFFYGGPETSPSFRSLRERTDPLAHQELEELYARTKENYIDNSPSILETMVSGLQIVGNTFNEYAQSVDQSIYDLITRAFRLKDANIRREFADAGFYAGTPQPRESLGSRANRDLRPGSDPVRSTGRR